MLGKEGSGDFYARSEEILRKKSMMENKGKILVIIPAYNEEGSVGKVLEGVKQYLPGVDALAVNDGSTDLTSEKAGVSGAIVLDLPFNLGIGEAMQAGCQYAFGKGYGIPSG